MEVQHGIHEYWTGLPFPTPGNLPHPGIEPTSLAMAGRLSTTVPHNPGIKLVSLASPAWARKFFITEPPGKE